ncbi:MAG: glycerol-3-phosphate ABC transporter ATP-binding protein [Pyrinomonas sp.]|uniref:ABC transporter ATP-binding protein n=1 Tax=Pyrinomonas sp. TaxID=2080306 RepID=UPI0033311920
MAELVLKNVSKVYENGVHAVSDVDLEVGSGEFIVLVGPSGCGKSTLLRMIAGLETVSKGEIWIGGKLVNDVPAKDRDIAMVFQNYALYPHMTVYENMAFGLRMRRLPKAEIERRVRQAAETLGLVSLLDRRPKELSGGQRQRVAVGRAIVRQPKLFLFDEPLSNLDAKLRVEMRAELLKLHRRLKATAIYVTHDQVEAMSMGDRLVVVEGGVVQQIGPPLEVYRHPANVFVASFIGSPPMNLITCEIQERDGQLRFVRDRLALDATAEQKRLLQDRPSTERRIIIGIRPEDVREAEPGAREAIEARVELLELLGSEALATCSVAGQQITVRLGAQTATRADSSIGLRFDMKRAKLFDAATGKAIG